MYRTKKDVDKYTENLISKLSEKEFKTRAYSVARLFFEVGDYSSCQKYVEQYLTLKDNNAAAYKLLAQASQKLGQKEKALEYYKTSIEIDSTQTSTILDICELLADDEVTIDPGRAKYWCEKAEATFPRHPITFHLRERLMAVSNPNPEAFVDLIKSELEVRPKDTSLHVRLLQHYLQNNQIKQAFDHSCKIEFGGSTFLNNYAWYEILTEVLKHNLNNTNDWLYQLLLLTVKERISVLSLTETIYGSSKGLIESCDLLHDYDQAIENVAKAGPSPGFGEFHSNLLQHHRGQFAFHAATYLLKKAKKAQINWRDATRFAAPLMLIAWHTVPLDSKVKWLAHAPDKQKLAVNRWYTEGTFRCSQSGHYLLSNVQDKSQSFLDKISQICSGTHWRDKLYEKLFTSQDHLAKMKSSHLVSNAYSTPVLRLPRKIEVEAYDPDAQREYATSLHHFVWTLLNYKNFANFKCTLFDMLTPTSTNCGPETLNKMDVEAFLYSAALTSRQQRPMDVSYITTDKPSVLPANISDLLCPLAQMKWWDCAYKFSQNELGTELTDIRATLTRGIETIRCVDNHGLDPELLCILGNIFSEKAKHTTAVDEKTNLEIRAGLYYSSAIPMLEKLKNKINVKMPEKRMFDYVHKDFGMKELNSLLEESKLFVAISYYNECDYEKVIDLLFSLKCPQAYYYLGQTYKKIALEQINLSRDANSADVKSKYSLLSKAKSFAYKALDRVKEIELDKNHALYSEIQQLLEEIETTLNKMDPDLSSNIVNDIDGKYSSDENISTIDHMPMRNNFNNLRNLSSTPKQQPHANNVTNYRTAVDSQIFDTNRTDQQLIEKIENQMKTFQKRLTEDFMEQTKSWFEENQRLGNKIMNTLQSDIQNTNDQFKLLKISVDQVKDQIDECRNECKDVGDLKKQIADLKKEVNKLKKTSSDQTIDESDLYNLDEDYRTTDSASAYSAQLPFQAPQVMSQFNQRLVPPFPVPPNPFQLYNQNLYNLYNQYSQFAQSPAIPGAPPIFDPARGPVNYPGIYPTSDQMYLDVAHLVQPNVASAPTVPVPTVPPPAPAPASVSTIPTAPKPSTQSVISASKATSSKDSKDAARALPVNVVITSSDPLPTCTSTPAPILSVTIPQKHIKGTPHNYQIPMPSVSETKTTTPSVFSFPTPGNQSTTTSSLPSWPSSTAFKSTPNSNTSSLSIKAESLFHSSKGNDTLDASKNEIDGSFGVTPYTSINKSRTLSERSNTSVENYDPCPDFKPIIPLPAEVKVTTGEEEETAIFSARAKLFRFVDKQWKERGIGEMKLLKHNVTGKVRVLMRREQIHKICANHIITVDMEIKPMKNEAKAYFWVANDFADETVVLEKFCIRFKTADIALQFYEAFEKARLMSKYFNTHQNKFEIGSKDMSVSSSTQAATTTPIKIPSQPAKTEFGGFTFTSTPTIKSETTKVDNKESDSANTSTTKINVFSGLSFKPATSSPFSNIFTSPDITNQINTVATPKTMEKVEETPTKQNTSDAVEEFEPTTEFKPVVPLPALVDQKTGEEDENILFEHRAKLLRFDSSCKEWKERGLGNIKVLIHKDNSQKVRLLMRREQIMKVCCNHSVTKDMSFQKMTNMDKAVTWCAKDFSDGELVAETFCLRFKTVQICDEFLTAIRLAQSKISDEPNKEQAIVKQSNEIGFGDKFKPKPGAWQCNACYTNNLESFAKCVCCEQPKPETSSPGTNWGDKFKPKVGSWECNSCLVRNEANIEACSACNNPKDPNKITQDKKMPCDSTPKFSFGIPKQDTTNKLSEPTPTSGKTNASGWGDKFKAKEGTWECQQCLIRNNSDVEKCVACNSPKDPTAKQEESSIFSNNTLTGPKFSFGIPASTTNTQESNTLPTSILDGSGTHKFSFGISSNSQGKTHNVLSFGSQNPSIFGVPKSSITNDSPVILTGTKEKEESKLATPLKTALLPTPQTNNPSLGNKENNTFDFVFKPKTPSKGKSPVKSPKSNKDDESDDNEYASEDEGQHIHFNPVIPMPDKVEVVTGEENEIELYGHRAKLYRFTSGEWKERGIGVVKILKHKNNNKLRVVMRREQVLKICLNHALTPEIIYNSKDDKTWLFAANDFSEGELNLQQFCLRFKTKEIAIEFKKAVDKARGQKSATTQDKQEKVVDTDDVVFVNELQATPEEKQRAKELMLPENFFTYKYKKPCQGCRGCQEKDDLNSEVVTMPNKSILNVIKESVNPETPVKLASANESVYGTPANFDRNSDTSVFRTPLGSLLSNTPTSSPFTPNSNVSDSDKIDKENTYVQKSIFTGIGGQTSNMTSIKPANLFGAGDTQATPKGLVLAAPKLNISSEEPQSDSDPKFMFGVPQQTSIFGDTKPAKGDQLSQPESKSIFGTAQTKSSFGKSSESGADSQSESKSIFNTATKSVFGESKSVFGASLSTNKSIFGVSSDAIPKTEAPSIFGGEEKPLNLFSDPGKGSIFGSGTALNSQPSGNSGIFGSTGTSIFGKAFTKTENTGSAANIFQNAANQLATTAPTATPTNDKKPEEGVKKESLFKVDNSLSFAALSSSGPGFTAQKKADFQWEGTGQQLFTGSQKPSNKEAKSQNDSGAGGEGEGAGADEEYDPHYEPIVPLPDKIVVTTGEEDEEKVFGERCKLYRYDEKTKEWKERGVGEMKILYHKEKKTYRLLLRREQVHKAVLNMLLFMDLELLPMKNSDRAWTWAGRNFAESRDGEQETLAVRFKSVDLAAAFRDKVVESVRKLQAAAAQAISKEKENTDKSEGVTSLRLPKHLQESARADPVLASKAAEHAQALHSSSQAATPNGETNKQPEMSKQVHFYEPQEGEEPEDEYDYQNEDYDAYYNEDEEESGAYYACDGEVVVQQEGGQTNCENAHLMVMFDQELYSPKILVTDNDTGEILADMLIHTDTEFHMSGDVCSWSGTDYTNDEAPVEKTVTVNFYDADTAMQFYDSCETSKSATYTSTDPEA